MTGQILRRRIAVAKRFAIVRRDSGGKTFPIIHIEIQEDASAMGGDSDDLALGQLKASRRG